MLTQSSGRLVASAILLIPIVDELLASTESGGASRSSSANIWRFTLRSSNTASMTKSALPTASARSVVVRTRAAAASASSADRRPFSTRRFRCPRFDSKALFSCSSVWSWSPTSMPCSAACWATCAPIDPAPTTARCLTRGPRKIEDFVGYSLHREDSSHRVEGHDVGQQAVDLQLARQQLRGHTTANAVVINRQPEQSNLQVAEAHDRVGVGADRHRPPRAQAVVDHEFAALEVERDALVDVGHEDADTGNQRVEVTRLLGSAPDVGLDQPAQH